MSQPVTPEQWNKLEDRYGKLIHTIAHNISGDDALLAHDDKEQELRRALLEAIGGFERQDNGKNGTLEDFIDTPGFNKYVKTTLWNAKNGIGTSIKKRYPINNKKVSIHNDGEEENPFFQIADSSAVSRESEVVFNDLLCRYSSFESDIIQLLIDEPSATHSDGTINYATVARKLNSSPKEIERICRRIFSDKEDLQ